MHTECPYEIDELVSRYVAGTIDSRSLGRLKAWACQSASHRDCVCRRIELGMAAAVAADGTPFDAGSAYRRFLEAKAADACSAAAAPPPNASCRSAGLTAGRVLKRVAVAAAVAVAVALLPLAGYIGGRQTVESGFADIVVDVPLGGRMQMTLPDSTRVWLNSGSRLVYSQGFGVTDRRLSLSGEGFFDVARNAGKPFTVCTREMDVRVVGTRFNLRNYEDDDEVAVSLIRGRVALANRLRRDSDIYLNPMHSAVLDKRTGRITLRPMRTGGGSAWAQGELFFDESLLSDIAKKIERSYGVRVDVADSVRSRRFYGSFSMDGESPGEILQAIAATGGVRCRAKDRRHYVLY